MGRSDPIFHSLADEVREELKRIRTRDRASAGSSEPPDATRVAYLIIDYGLTDDAADELMACATMDAAVERAIELQNGG